MDAHQETCTVALEELANHDTRPQSHDRQLEGNVDIKDTALYPSLRPLILLMKAFGLFYHGSKTTRNRLKMILSSIYPVVLIALNVYVIANNILLVTGFDSKLQLLRTVAFIILSIIIYPQSTCFYITRYSCSGCFVDFLLKCKGFKLQTKTQRGIVIAIMTLLSALHLSVFLWSLLSYFLHPMMKMYRMKDISVLPIASTEISIGFHHGILFLIILHGSFAGNLLLQQYCIVCSLLIIEFKSWNRTFSQRIGEDGAFSGSLEENRIKFVKLADLVDRASTFLSPYPAILLSLTVPTLCFLLYLLTKETLAPIELTGSLSTLIYTCLSLSLVFIAGCLLNHEVSIYFISREVMDEYRTMQIVYVIILSV